MISTSPDMDALKARLGLPGCRVPTAISPHTWNRPLCSFLLGLRFLPEHKCWMSPAGQGESRSRCPTGTRVTGIDIAPNLIEQARVRAHAEGVVAWFDEGDAEALPYDNASFFDMVVSLIGAMFRPTSRTVAVELLHVCRPEERVKRCEDNECKVEREDRQKSMESQSQGE